MRRGAAALAVALALGSGAGAAEPCGTRTLVLDCPVSARDRLTICIGEGRASYRFGPPAAPELTLEAPLSTLQGEAWAGVGRTIWEEITFANGAYRYAVWHSIDRLEEDHPTGGGVEVRRGDVRLARIECLPGRAEIGLFAISDGFAAAGRCWDRRIGAFARRC